MYYAQYNLTYRIQARKNILSTLEIKDTRHASMLEVTIENNKTLF